MASCHLCNEHPNDAGMLDHIRVHHPEEYGDGPESWPDGGLVIVDSTVETPADI